MKEPQNEKPEEGERLEEAMGGSEESKEKSAEMSRKEKRKAMKKLKRKQVRKEIASKEREEAEAKLNDPAEQERLKAIEEEEERKREKELKEFEESERAWREAMEIKRKKEEEEERRWKELEESRKLEASRDDEDGEYEYIEEGPPEIIFQGNEIILRKNKVRVLKKTVAQVDVNEVADRPTSNPLPPGTEASSKSQNVSSAQQILDSVAQEVPNFGTEQDKAHCPFHLKTGACRFGPRCSRVHFYPDKSCSILMKNMYSGPGIDWEHDEGLEVCNRCHLVILTLMDSLRGGAGPGWSCSSLYEEAEHCYEEFYEDVHTEFLKYGELVNFKVCRNGSLHLKGNVYVHYRSLESANLAYQSINGRYFAGKQVNCEFVNISRWKVAICGEYMKSRLKTCSRGSACNFIHCFRNPGGDYEWADYDKPPPRFWIRKMTALFGYSDEYLKHTEREYSGSLSDYRSEQPTDSQRQPSRRSRSRDYEHVNVGSKPSYRSGTRDSSRGHKLSRHEENCHGGDGSPSSNRDGSVEREIYKETRYAKETSRHESKWSEHSPRKRIRERYSDDEDSGDDDGRGETSHKRKSSRRYSRRGSDSEVQERLDYEEETRNHGSGSDRRSRKEDDREGGLSSADQKESHAHNKFDRERSSSSRHRPHRGSDQRDKGENVRRRSVETDREKSKQRRRNKSGDPDSSDRSMKEKQGREPQEVKRHRKRERERERENVSGEEREARLQKERSRSSSSCHRSQEQTSPKEAEEIERWRPV